MSLFSLNDCISFWRTKDEKITLYFLYTRALDQKSVSYEWEFSCRLYGLFSNISRAKFLIFSFRVHIEDIIGIMNYHVGWPV